MSIWSLLLHVLLGVSLAGNGIATAALSVSMPGMPMPIATMPMAAAHAQGEAAHHAGDAGSCERHQGAQDQQDCCKSGLCACACAQGAQVALAGAIAGPTMALHHVHLSALSRVHVAPGMLRLIRPPIG